MRGRLRRCTHLEALEPLLKGAPQNILKYAVHQFAKVREGVPREYPLLGVPHSEHLPCIVPIKSERPPAASIRVSTQSSPCKSGCEY